MKVKKILLSSFIFAVLNSFLIFAAEPANFQDFELDTLLHDIEKPGKPIITDDYIIFTAPASYRFVGIAFDFENYQVIHPFQVMTHTDDDEKVTRSHLFYCFKREHRLSQIKYRLIFDGLWSYDPLNPDKEYDENENLYFSVLTLPDGVKIQTEKGPDNKIHFVYKGESGLDIHLAGTFTNWDPWIYTIPEIRPGFYEIDLPLPKGKYYYNYYIGLTPILDSTNPEKVYSLDGKSASVIVVD